MGTQKKTMYSVTAISAALAAPSAPGIQRSRRPEGAGPAVVEGDRAMRAMYHNRPLRDVGRRGGRRG